MTNYTKDGQYYYSGSYKYYVTTKATFSNTSTQYNDAMTMIQDYKVGDNTYETFSYWIIYPKGTDDALSNYYGNRYTYTISEALIIGNININLNSGAKITGDVYGGGKNGAVTGDITININSGARVLGNVYGGGEGLSSEISSNVINTNFIWTNSTENYVATVSTFNTACMADGTKFTNAPSEGNYTEKFLILTELKENFMQDDGKIYIYSDTISKLGLIDGNTTINMNGGTVSNIYGGSNGQVASVSGDTTILIKGGQITNIYGGGNNGEITSSYIEVQNGTISRKYIWWWKCC